MNDADYFDAPGLSNSMMKDLSVSPLRMWHLHVNPNRPEKRETPEMRFGSALHMAVLQPDTFENFYACELDQDAYPGLLDTMDDLRTWLKDKGCKPQGTRKADLITQALMHDPQVPILDVLETQHAEKHAGKVMFSKADWFRIGGAANALRSEPEVAAILDRGIPEVPMFAHDPSTGVPLKGRLDWLAPECTLDLKTFSATRGKPIDRAVCDAIWYEGYHRQGYFYSMLRALQGGVPGKPKDAVPFVLAFVESDEPFEVRIKVLSPTVARQPCLYWERARVEVRGLIDLYAECLEKYGERPWREPRNFDPLLDEQIPQVIYS